MVDVNNQNNFADVVEGLWARLDEPGVVMSVSPVVADEMGAFTEDAISLDDALDSAVYLKS